jgi:16S rRNA (uracil1498-N3)-methyltransferase
MTRRRFIADEFSATTAALTGIHADHLVRVLRASLGQEFDISAGGSVRRGRITSISDSRVDFELGDKVAATPSTNVTLLLAIFKFDRMEWAIEKCTELGVARIVPVIARRTDTHLAAASAKRAERWRRLALQASEQARRTAPPEIGDSQKLKQAIVISGGLGIVLNESEQKLLLRDVVESHSPSSEIVLAIGPEGGWTQDELTLFNESGWLSASLGPNILRAETAAIAATVMVLFSRSS